MSNTCARETDGIGWPSEGWGALLGVLLQGRARRRALLDPMTLSDHLKRDMGFLDGKDPAGRRP